MSTFHCDISIISAHFIIHNHLPNHMHKLIITHISGLVNKSNNYTAYCSTESTVTTLEVVLSKVKNPSSDFKCCGLLQ